MRPRWGLVGSGVALLLAGPVGLYVVLTYAYRGEPPWLVPLYYASIAAPVLGLGLVAIGLIARRRS